MSGGGAIVIRITADGPKARVTIDIPESLKAALRAKSMTEDRTQSELATEALIRFLTAPIGTFSPQPQPLPGTKPKESTE